MNYHLIIGLILSGVIGLSLGLIGGGGSIITVPVLVYIIGVDPHEAVAISLAVVGVTSVIGTLLHYRQGNVNVKKGLVFGIVGMVGAYLGTSLTYLFTPAALMLIFAALMLVIAILMLIKRADIGTVNESSIIKAVLAGFVVGLLTGFLGVGGGFLIVPALVLFGGLAMREAIGTSLFVIAINCTTGLIGHLHHHSFDLKLTMLITIIAVAGTLIGTTLSHKVSPEFLRRGFSIFVIIIALFLLAKNYSILLP